MNGLLIEESSKPETNKKKKIMNRGIGIALLVIGIALIIYGSNASNSVSSDVSRTFTGAPTNKAMWLLWGGSAAAIIGAVMTFRPSSKAK
jgi:hypothetical protein